MTRRKLNVPVLLILIGTVIVLAGGVYVLNKFQIRRLASNQRQYAETALKDNKTDEAINALNKYLHYYPKDAAAYLQFAELSAERAHKNKNDIRMQENALAAQETAYRLPDNRNNRDILRNMADLSLRLRRFEDAIKHYRELIREFPNDYQMMMNYAEALSERNFYQDALTVYRDIIRKEHTYFPAYLRIAELSADKLGAMSDAETILEQMVEMNKDSGEAFAYRSRFFVNHDKIDEARTNLQTAKNLSPDNKEVLVTSIELFMRDKKYTEADNELTRFQSLFPKDDRALEMRSNLELMRNNPEAAEAAARQILANDNSPVSKIKLLDILIKSGKITEAKEYLVVLSKENFPAFILNFFEGQIAIYDKSWRMAAQKLEQAKLEMQMYPEMLPQTNMLLGIAYEQLEVYDRQLDAFKQALDEIPKSVRARTGYALALFHLGRKEEAREELIKVKEMVGDEAFYKDPRLKATFLQLEISRQQQLPPEQRTGDILQSLTEEGQPDLDDPINVLSRAEALVKQKDFDKARDLLTQACGKNPKQGSYWSALAMLSIIQGDNVGAQKCILEAKEKVGYSPALLNVELKLILAQGTEGAEGKIDALIEEVGKLPPDQRQSGLKSLSEICILLGASKKAQGLLTQLYELNPDNTNILLRRFQLARASDDEKTMDEMIDKIHSSIGTKTGEYDYVQAAKIVWNVRHKKMDISNLTQAKDLLRQVYQARNNWSEGPQLRYEMAIIENVPEEAIDALLRMRDLAGLTTQQNAQLVHLLYREQRYDEAKQIINQMGDIRDDRLKRLQAGIEANSGDIKAALATARETAKNSSNALELLWYGQIALKAGETDEAEKAIRKSIAVDPANIEAQIALISLLKEKGDMAEIDNRIEDMDKHFEGETLALGKAEALRIKGDAPNTYRAFVDALQKYPENLTLLYSMSQFMLQTTRPDGAMPYLQRIMQMNDRNPDPNKTRLHWARRNYVRLLLSVNNNMDNQEESIKLLDTNISESDEPAVEDVKMKAIILVSRNNPRDRMKAIQLIEGLLKRRVSLEPEEQFILGRLYNEAEQWDKAKAQMIDLVVREPDNMRYLTEFIRMMLRRNRPAEEIQPRIARLEQLFPNLLIPILLRSELLHVQEKDKEAAAMLTARFNSTPEDKYQELPLIARQLDRIGQMQPAEDAYKQIVQKMPKGLLDYVRFLGRRGRLEEAFDQLELVKGSDEFTVDDILTTLVDVVRICPRDPTASQLAHAEKILQGYVKDMPDNLSVQIQLAEFRMLQKQVEETERIYDSIINRGSLTDWQKVVFYNNMSYALSVTERNPQKALDMINEAIKIQGPVEYLLDTRALALLAFNDRDPVKLQQAINDLERAVAKNPTAIYYFHLARAYQANSDRDNAKATMDICRNQYEMTIQDVPRQERAEYGKMLTNM